MVKSLTGTSYVSHTREIAKNVNASFFAGGAWGLCDWILNKDLDQYMDISSYYEYNKHKYGELEELARKKESVAEQLIKDYVKDVSRLFSYEYE